MKKHVLLFTLLAYCTTGNAQRAASILQQGDLVFQDLDCGAMCDAIEAVTQGWGGKHFSHMGIIEKAGDTVYVWESAGPGVRRVAIDSFAKRSEKAIIIGRLKNKYQKLIPAAINFIRQNKGAGYDDVFLYGNDKYYCSELIYDAFKHANKSKPFFKLFPMTFKRPGSLTYFPVWIEYYEKLKTQIPEGAPGCNPGSISRSGKINMIGLY